MWTCKICDAEVDEDTWQTCWRCSSPRDLAESQVENLRDNYREKINTVLHCLRCKAQMKHVGTKRFEERNAFELSFAFFDLSDVFSSNPRYDIYVCPNCGKAEFFVDGIGDELRGEDEGL